MIKKYNISTEDLAAIEPHLPAGILFAYEEEGIYVHENTTEEYGIDYDAIISASGLAASYEAYLASASEVLPCRIYDYVYAIDGHDHLSPPQDMDFRTALTVKPIPVRVFEKGLLIQTTWYASATLGPTGAIVPDPATEIVQEDTIYGVDFAGFIRSRSRTVKWTLTDGTYHSDTKSLPKLYNNAEASKAGQRQRSNIVEDTKMKAVAMLFPTYGAASLGMGRDFMQKHDEAFRLYERDSNDSLLAEINNDTDTTWLNLNVTNPADGAIITLRQFMHDSAAAIWA